MLLLLDIGNTNTHLGLVRGEKIIRTCDMPTSAWSDGTAEELLVRFTGRKILEGISLCSVVPLVTKKALAFAATLGLGVFELTARTVSGIGIDYPKPRSIGPDRLANSLAAFCTWGAPVVVVDFGTAVTFDVVDRTGNYIGGIIAPGLSAMTSYLHEKTALLPRIKIRETQAVVGRNTREAMLIGAVHGYRGLIKELLKNLRRELGVRKLRVVATGGYAGLIASQLPEIQEVCPNLTLHGLRLAWKNQSNTKQSEKGKSL